MKQAVAVGEGQQRVGSDSAPAQIVWVLYDSSKAGVGIALANRLGSRTVISEVVVVWNGAGDPPPVVEALREHGLRAKVLRGSNSAREFGGYQEGVNQLRECTSRGIYFFNDTAGSHSYLPWYFVDRLVKASWSCENEAGSCVGQVWRSRESLQLGSLEASFWMQSNLFFIDVVALRALDWRIRASEIDIWIRERLDGSFFGPEIGNALQSRVRDWLFKPGLRAWYAAGPLTDGNLGAMAAKARAVLQEHYFSMRLQSEGVLVVPPSLGFLQDKWMKFVDACGMLARYCGLKLKIGR